MVSAESRFSYKGNKVVRNAYAVLYVEYDAEMYCRPTVAFLLMQNRKLGKPTGTHQIYDASEFLKITVNGEVFTGPTQENSYSNGIERGSFATPELRRALGRASEVKAQMGMGFAIVFEDTDGKDFRKGLQKASQRCKNP